MTRAVIFAKVHGKGRGGRYRGLGMSSEWFIRTIRWETVGDKPKLHCIHGDAGG